MNWGSPQDFFAMGGYGLYVWGSYAVATACIVAELWILRRRRRTLKRALSRRSGDRGRNRASGQT
jgi:heme exporter protein D